jgi:hypothetical protein
MNHAQKDRHMAKELAAYYADRDGTPWFVVRCAKGKYNETVSVEREAPATRRKGLLEFIKINPKGGKP